VDSVEVADGGDYGAEGGWEFCEGAEDIHFALAMREVCARRGPIQGSFATLRMTEFFLCIMGEPPG
jgi:hypothetical protein